ncbi:c-type cytochrome [Sediminibacterium ginsengisoli]|nr:cytochrome c [Sediminibacterium ginsengisoli]
MANKKKLFFGAGAAIIMLMTAFRAEPVQQPVAVKASAERGKQVYVKRCMACHQADGGGVPHLNAPLDGASAVTGKDKAKLIKIVLNGMTDRVEIDGEFYSNNMPGNKDLTDAEIADVLTYVRTGWSNKSSAVTVAEVKAVRTKK